MQKNNALGRPRISAEKKLKHQIAIVLDDAQFAWLRQQPGTSGAVIRRLIEEKLKSK